MLLWFPQRSQNLTASLVKASFNPIKFQAPNQFVLDEIHCTALLALFCVTYDVSFPNDCRIRITVKVKSYCVADWHLLRPFYILSGLVTTQTG
jgi:hypothetical protein